MALNQAQSKHDSRRLKMFGVAMSANALRNPSPVSSASRGRSVPPTQKTKWRLCCVEPDGAGTSQICWPSPNVQYKAGAVISNATSQQEGCGFESLGRCVVCVGSLRVLWLPPTVRIHAFGGEATLKRPLMRVVVCFHMLTV